MDPQVGSLSIIRKHYPQESKVKIAIVKRFGLRIRQNQPSVFPSSLASFAAIYYNVHFSMVQPKNQRPA